MVDTVATFNPSASGHAHDAWDIARLRYLANLDSDEEKELFATATLENVYYSTSNLNIEDYKKSKSRKVIDKLQPFVNTIEDYGKAIDAFSNIQPMFLAPIWGSIRVILVVAARYSKFYDKMVETLSRIGDILPRLSGLTYTSNLRATG
jgi:hypothetical protein